MDKDSKGIPNFLLDVSLIPFWLLSLRYREVESPTCNAPQCDGRCERDIRCIRDGRRSPGMVPCMIRREPVDDRCYLGKDCPGSNCPYAMASTRSPSGTVYITVPAINHHVQSSKSVVYSKAPPSPYLAPKVHIPDHVMPHKRMVNAETQTSPELLQNLLMIKQEPIEKESVPSPTECNCNCKSDYRPSIVVFRDGKATSVEM